MHSEIQDPLRQIQGPHAPRFLARGRENELVHAEALVRRVVRFLEPGLEVVRVHDGLAAHLRETLRAQALHIAKRPHDHPEIAVIGVDPADRARPVVVPPVPVSHPFQNGGGKVGREILTHAEHSASRPAAAVRRGKGLVEVDVREVESHRARIREPDHRVQIRAVQVEQAAGGVHDPRDLTHVALEDPERVRVREHERRGLVRDLFPQRLEIHAAIRPRGHGDRAVADLVHGGGIRAVRRVGHDHLFARVPARLVIGPRHEDRRQLALGAGGGLRRDRRHPHDRLQPLVELPDHRQSPLREVLGLERMERLKSRQLSHFMVQEPRG